MNELKVVSINGQLVTESREVAKMIDRPHSDLLKSIRGYAKHLTKGNFTLSEFFIESTYEDSTGRSLPSYYLTKQGCEMVANKMTGEKGVLFTAAYVAKFNEMENKPRILTEKEQLRASMRLSLETSEELEGVKKDVNMLKDTMRIDGVQEHKLQKHGRRKVVKVLGGKNSPAYKEVSRSIFQLFWNEFKDHFLIPRYNELPKKDYEEAIRFIDLWQPKTSERLKIDAINNQMTLGDDAS